MVLIDAHNILFRLRTHRRLASWSLLTLAGELAARRLFRREVVLVCDGDPPPGLLALWTNRAASRGEDSVVFHFSGAGVEADDVIAGLIEASLRPAGLLVVSSDQAVRASARALGASELSGETLVGWLTHWKQAPTPARPAFAEAVPLTRGEVELWLRDLGIDAAGNSTLPATSADRPRVVVGQLRRRMRGDSRPGQPATPSGQRDQNIDPSLLDMERWLRLFPPSDSARRGE
jgi:hypothetical protein